MPKRDTETAGFLSANNVSGEKSENVCRTRINSSSNSMNSQPVNNVDAFSRLSDEMLLRIFSYLNSKELALSVSPVNRRFRNIARDPTLWVELHLTLREYSVEAIIALINRCTKVKSLTLTYVEPKSKLAGSLFTIENNIESLFEAVGASTLHLKVLNLHGDWTPKMLRNNEATIACFSGLRELHMRSDCPHLGSKRNRMYHVNNNFTSEGLAMIGQHCVGLKSFTYQMCDEDFPDNNIYQLPFLGAMKKTLQRLEFGCNGVMYDALAGLDECLLLHTLKMKFLYLDDDRILEYLPKLSNLSILDMDICDGGLTAGDLVNLFSDKKMQKLSSLRLYENDEVDDSVLAVIADNCPLLTHLNLSYCQKLTEVGLVEIKKLQKLTELDLSHINVVDNDILEVITENSPLLSKLSFTGCNKLNNISLAIISFNCSRLTSLEIGHENMITVAGLTKIWNVLPRLKVDTV